MEKLEMMQEWEGRLPVPQVRTIDEMRCVLRNPDCTVRGNLYTMYRNLAKTERDRRWLESQNLRYDITVIPPNNLCGEYVKTKGHYHPPNSAGIGYPEVYEVIEGAAHYLIQKRNLEDVSVITASEGDVVVIPPGYGHVTINPGNTQLVMANIVSDRFSSEYALYEKLHGAAYYECIPEGFVKNTCYGELPSLRWVSVDEIREKVTFCRSPLYSMIGDNEALAFLNRPEEFLDLINFL